MKISRPPSLKGSGEKGTAYGGWLDLALQTALTLALTVLAGVFGGRWLDSFLGTTPIFIIIGSLWGAGFGTYWVILKVKQFSDKKEQEESPPDFSE